MNQTRTGLPNGETDASRPADQPRGGRATTEHLASMAHDTVDRVADAANQAERQLRGAATRTAEHARELQGQAAEMADEHVQKVRSYVRENPFTSAGIAFAAGVILSAILRR